ncbi:MAG: hypothetical protein J0G30_10090 [Actinomycetales bacterium]|nr:hypothetical protein [Actinomycetales bacterium]
MTLSKDDPDHRRRARAERHQNRAELDTRRPWLFPLVITLAVLAVVAVVGYLVLQAIG